MNEYMSNYYFHLLFFPLLFLKFLRFQVLKLKTLKIKKNKIYVTNFICPKEEKVNKKKVIITIIKDETKKFILTKMMKRAQRQ
jgi:hypothetical protein